MTKPGLVAATLMAVLTIALIAAAPIAMAQQSSNPQVVADAKAKTATAGGAKADASCANGEITSIAGGVVAKAPCTPPPPPPPKAAPAPPPPPPAPTPAPAPKAELPKTGGAGVASWFALGAGALLVAGGLVARRIIK